MGEERRTPSSDDLLLGAGKLYDADLLAETIIADLALASHEEVQAAREAQIVFLAAVSVVFDVQQKVEENMGLNVTDHRTKSDFMLYSRTFQAQLSRSS